MMSASDLAVRWNLRLLHGRQEWRGTCPACGYANAFALTERDGNVLPWCFSGQDPNALGGLMRGMGRATGRVAPLPQRIDQGRQKARAESLWRRGIPCVGTPAATYLGVRGLPGLATSLALRFCWDTPHPTRCALPAMLALVEDVHGEPVGVHRTYLRPDGIGKAAVNPQRATLGQVAGGAIRLHPEASELVIGEGIETAASTGQLIGLPAWAAISAGNMARTMALPATVESVVIAADHDAPGKRSADAAKTRWNADGLHIRIIAPNRPGADFNDVLREKHHG